MREKYNTISSSIHSPSSIMPLLEYVTEMVMIEMLEMMMTEVIMIEMMIPFTMMMMMMIMLLMILMMLMMMMLLIDDYRDGRY